MVRTILFRGFKSNQIYLKLSQDYIENFTKLKFWFYKLQMRVIINKVREYQCEFEMEDNRR